MYEISCQMCQDLIPLVEDDVASADSRDAVAAHIKVCPECRELYAGEKMPRPDEEKAVSRFIGRLKLFGLLLLAVGAVAGIVMIEQRIQGMTAVFALLAFLTGWMLRFAWTKSATMKGRAGRVLVAVLAIAVAAGMFWLANVLVGNPVSAYLAREGAKAYLQEHYPGTDYTVERVTHNFLHGEYYAVITSPSSIDGDFELSLDMNGNVTWDGYELYVASGENTQSRIYSEYRDLVDPILKRLNLETSVHIGFGRLEIDEGLLVVDADYDIAALGAEQGHLIVTVRDEAVTPERAAELLTLIDSLMTEHGGTFATIDLTIYPPATDVPSDDPGTVLELEGFLRSDIPGEGLPDRIREAAVFRTY